MWAKLIFVAILLVPLASASSADPIVEFASPAQLAGGIQAEGLDWAVFVFEGPAHASFDVSLDGIWRAQNHTSLSASRDEFLIIGNTSTTNPPRTQDLPHPHQIEGRWSWTRPGSLIVVAESISVKMNARAELATARPDQMMWEYATPANFTWDLLRAWDDYPVATDDIVVMPGDLDPRHMTINARGIHLLEWFHADVACEVECLPGGGAARIATAKPARVDLLSYITVQSSSGTLTGTATVSAAAFGGRSPSIATEGYGRFAQANLVGDCDSNPCPDPDGQAFRANGTLWLRDLERIAGEPGRMRAKFSGEITAASFDEEAVLAWSGKTVRVGVAVLALAALAKAAFALFTRHHRPALEHPRIRRMFDFIVAQPGLSFSELKRRTGAANGDLIRQLTKLEGEGLVVARDYRNSKRYYENHGRYDADWQRHAALQDDRCRLVYDWLTARPGSTQTQVLHALRGLARSTLQHAIQALLGAGLLRQERQGRFVHYWAMAVDNAPSKETRGTPSISGGPRG